MLLPSYKWSFVLADIPELLLWNITVYICLSKITATENEL